MKGYEYLAQLIKENETTHIFFQEVSLRMVGKLAEYKYGIKGIMGHCEKSVAYMADGYARVSGKVGVCSAQSIGAANLAAGLADAALAKTPIVAITGKKPPSHQNRNSYQELNHTKLFEEVSKYQSDITTPAQFASVCKQAFREAATGKPGPVHVDMLGIACHIAEFFDVEEEFIAEPKFGKLNPFRPSADPVDVRAAASQINDAKKPIIVVGRGANMSGAGDEIYQLAKKADIPIVTTPDGKTVIDEEDGLWVGVVGDYGMECGNLAVMDSDLVIFIGTQTSDQTTCDWRVPSPSTPVIQIDISPAEIGRNYANCVGLCGDAKAVVAQLIPAVAANNHKEWRTHTAELLADNVKKIQDKINAPSGAIRTEKLCDELSKVLPEDAVLISDTGYAAVWTSTIIRMKPTQKYFRAAGSLGWAYPASLGAKCAAPEKPVVCFIGDGGFYYNMSEMETAVRYNLPTVTVVNNNNIYAQCMPSMKMVYADMMPEGFRRLSFAPLDISKIAASFGLFAVRVTNAEDIGPAITAALESGKPALVEVITEANSDIDPLPSMQQHV